MVTTEVEARPGAALLHSDNPFKLAVFGLNVSGGCALTTAEGTIQVEWNETKELAKAAEEAGIEALIPVARWKGLGGVTNFNDRCFETFTWAAGVAAVTERIQVFSTFHVPTVHPVRGAKEAATVDHIAGGRFGLNVVAGWNESEIGMFGQPLLGHAERYAMADEWITVAKRLWTEDRCDFEGTYYQTPGAHAEPKPLQRPHPVLMNAGASPAGLDFAAKHSDINFVVLPDLDEAPERIASIKAYARDKYDRDLKVMSMGSIVCRDTEKEAQDYFNYYVHEKGDWDAAGFLINGLVANTNGADYSTNKMAINLVAGYSALPLVGTPEQVVEGMVAMHDAGLDGITLSWVDYDEGLKQFKDELLPLMRQAGIRA